MNDNTYFLGQLLLNNEILYHSKVAVTDFETDFEVKTYTAIKDLFTAGETADIVTVHNHDKGIDISTLTALTTDVVPGTWKQIEKQIIKNTKRRQLLWISEMIGKEQDINIVVSEINRVLESFNDRTEFEIESSKEISEKALDLVEDRYKQKGVCPGIKSGIYKLDNYLLGFEKRRLYVFGARPSQGKTSLLLNFVNNCNETAGMLSAESSNQELMMRLFAINGRIRQKNIVSGYLRDSDFSKLIDVTSKYHEKAAYFYDEPNMSIDTAMIKAREMKRRFDIKILFVDYLQCLTGNPRLKRHEQVADISMKLKSIARSLDIPVVVAAQLRRDADGKRPLLSDFSDSTQIERDADTAVMIFNDTENTYLLIEKNRDGECKDIQVIFNREYLRFENIQRGEYE